MDINPQDLIQRLSLRIAQLTVENMALQLAVEGLEAVMAEAFAAEQAVIPEEEVSE